MIRYLALFAVLTLAITGCKSSEKKEVDPVEQTLPEPVISNYTVETFQREDNTWGYRILENGKMIINQPHIPAVQGNQGFGTKEKAEMTGNLMVSKIQKGMMPPTLTRSELDSLGVLN